MTTNGFQQQPLRPPALVSEAITKIPQFMRDKGWRNGATLLQKWFDGPANANCDASAPDTTTIKMDPWLLTFSRARIVYDQMVRERVWENPKAKELIKKRLRDAEILSAARACTAFNNLQYPANLMHRYHVNNRKVSDGPFAKVNDPLDDLFAALGKFAFYMVIDADVTPRSTQLTGRLNHSVTTRRVGVYARDNFDFKDDGIMSELLGFWNFETGDVSKLPVPGYFPVTNAHFNEWRKNHGRGSDFWVYSDIKILNINPPESFTIEQ